MGFPQEKTIIFCDRLSVICLAKDQVHFEWTKHNEVKYNNFHTEEQKCQRLLPKRIQLISSPKVIFRRNFMHV